MLSREDIGRHKAKVWREKRNKTAYNGCRTVVLVRWNKLILCDSLIALCSDGRVEEDTPSA